MWGIVMWGIMNIIYIFFFICIPIENTYVQRAFQLAVSVTMEGVIYLFHCLTLSDLLTFISIFSFVFLTIVYTYICKNNLSNISLSPHGKCHLSFSLF